MEKIPTLQSFLTKKPARIFSTGRVLMLAIGLLALASCCLYLWMTRDTVAQLSFLRQSNAGHTGFGQHKSLVDTGPWQTASTLLPMAVSAEEQDYARIAERLADHDVDQAFATAMRMASLRAHHTPLSETAQAFAHRVADLEQLVQQDQQQIRQLGADPDADAAKDAAKKNTDVTAGNNDDLELARAQLSLDSGQLDDARRALAHMAGDDSDQLQQELSNYHQAQQQAQQQIHAAADHALASVRQHHTLLLRLQALQRQNERAHLVGQAAAAANNQITALTAERAAAQKTLDAIVIASASEGRIEQLRDKNAERQILAIYDDRISINRFLSTVYYKWIAQVAVQHRILLHLIVASCAWIIAAILLVIVLGIFLQRLLEHLQLDNRQAHTLRTIARLGLQLACAAVVLLILFGVPEQVSTVLGLTTAALTIALQDFVLAFFGWFLLMGRQGIHVGDWVEINGVNGEVVDVGLFNTTLLELSSLTGKGHPTGRRIALLNSFAIRGQYFNFSTSGQWMWDEVSLGIPKTLDVHQIASEMEALVREKTAESTRAAEHDWQRVARGSSLSKLAATSAISLRPTVDGIEATIRYITRATDRFATRDKLYLQLLALLQKKQAKLTA